MCLKTTDLLWKVTLYWEKLNRYLVDWFYCTKLHLQSIIVWLYVLMYRYIVLSGSLSYHPITNFQLRKNPGQVISENSLSCCYF